MADIALVTADRVEVVKSIRQETHPAGTDIVAGAPLAMDVSGNYVPADGNGASPLNTLKAVATRSAKAGESCTGLIEGLMDGYAFTQAYGASIFVSDTVGTLADATGTATLIVGHVTSAHAQGLGTSADKILYVNIAG